VGARTIRTDRNTVIRPLSQDFDLRALHRMCSARYPYLLQSTAAQTHLGRYDILFAFPREELVLERSGQLSGHRSDDASQFLQALDDWWREERQPRNSSQLPFQGGWFLYLGYELAAEVEPVLDLEPDEVLPAAFAVRCPAAIVRDHHEGKSYFVAERTAESHYDELAADIANCAGHDGTGPSSSRHCPATKEDHPDRFLDAVMRAKDYIGAGDIYQANLSRRWCTTVDPSLDATDIYAALCDANPAPFAGLVRWRDVTVMSSSPERLVEIRDGAVSTRPIAGTRPRSDDRDLDDSLSAELFAHPKERAEHIMLIDLERNDLGRICVPGSVEVNEMMVLESYAHVHHIVSNVRGQLRKDITPGDTIRAVFPGGTITGCPKVRCMQIIHELERGPRGAYTGSFGYLNRDGSLDLNILIRTMVMQGNSVSLCAGSGIVADSEPQAELAETRAKAKGMIRALSP
jgi:anthranilate synthase component 1